MQAFGQARAKTCKNVCDVAIDQSPVHPLATFRFKMASALKVLDGLGKLDDIVRDINKAQQSRNVHEMKTNNLGVHCSLAPSFGTLTKDSIKQMDKSLLVILAGTLNAFAKDPDATTSWEKVMACLSQNSLLVRKQSGEVHKIDGYKIDESHDFKFDGSAEQWKVDEFVKWFDKFISDPDVLQDTKIDVRAIGNIIAQTGATVTDIVTLFDKHEHHELTAIDVGILRFPSLDQPHIKVYRIQVQVWSDCHRTMWHQDDHNGVKATFDSAQFEPNKEVLAKMKQETIDKGVEEAEGLFN